MTELTSTPFKNGTAPPGPLYGQPPAGSSEAPYAVNYGPDGLHAQQSLGQKWLENTLDLIHRRKRILLICFALVVAVTALFTFTANPEYETHSIVMVDLGTGMQDVEGGTGQARMTFTKQDRTLAGELFLLQTSHTIEQRVGERLREEVPAALEEEDYRIEDHVRFSVGGDEVNAIMIRAIGEEPETAAHLANFYAEEYVRLTEEVSRTNTITSRQLLQDLEEKRRQELTTAEEQLKAYQQEHGTVGISDEASFLAQEVTGLSSELDQARLELQTRRASLRSLQERIGEVNPRLARNIASSSELKIQAVQRRISDLEVAKQDIFLRYPAARTNEAEYPELRSLNQQIAQLQAEVDRLASQYAEEIAGSGGLVGSGGIAYVADLNRQAIQDQTSITALQARIDALEQRLAVHQGKLSSIPRQAMELARLERARQQAENIYQAVVTQLQEVRIAEESKPGYARVIRKATVPEAPVRPNPVRNMVLALLGGLFLGFSVAFVRDRLDNRLYKESQLRALGHPVLGVIPNLKPLVDEDHGGQPFVEQDGRRLATTLVALLNPLSLASEAYRHVRTNLQYSMPDTIVQLLLVTSPGPEEGKSTAVANLGVVMARAERRTLLVDADLRRPKLHELFGLACSPGLAHHLLTPGEPVVVTPTGVDNLDVLTAGELPAPGEGPEGAVLNPAELLGSRRLREILRDLRQQYDVIIVDTPPVTVATDASLLATQSDAALVVTRAGKTKVGDLEDSVHALQTVGARIIGTLFNGFELAMARGQSYLHQHYSRYGREARYGYYAKKPTKARAAGAA